MNFWNKICGLILFLIIFPLIAGAQNATAIRFNYHSFPAADPLQKGVRLDRNTSFCVVSQKIKSPVSENFSTASYGVFCREELKIEKTVKIPLRFRLGSLAQCNYYEGKRQ